MKKRLFAALAALLLLTSLALTACAAEQTEHILDLAGLLDADQRQTLELQAQAIETSYNCGLYIVTVDDYQDYADHPFDAACVIYDANGFGVGEDRDGLVLLLSMGDRDFATALYGPWAHTAFSDYALERQEAEFLDDFRYDDWYGGFADFLITSEQCLAAAAAGAPVERPAATNGPATGPSAVQGTHQGSKTLTWRAGLEVFGQDLAIALALGLVLCLALKSGMRSVRAQTTARGYLRADESCLTERVDQFTHATHARRTIQTNVNRSSGGHTHSHHSGGFSGRSGKF